MATRKTKGTIAKETERRVDEMGMPPAERREAARFRRLLAAVDDLAHSPNFHEL